MYQTHFRVTEIDRTVDPSDSKQEDGCYGKDGITIVCVVKVFPTEVHNDKSQYGQILNVTKKT